MIGPAQLPADAFHREDESDDGAFYVPERLVTHIDEGAVAALTEARRVLQRGGRLDVSISNRCFPTKAVRIWFGLDIRSRAGRVGVYLEAAGFSGLGGRNLTDGTHGDTLIVESAIA